MAYSNERNDDNPAQSIDIIVVLELEAEQEVWVRPSGISSMHGAKSGEGMRSWFSAHLVHPF